MCDLPFPEEFSAVYSTKKGQLLVGVSRSRQEVRLMAVGDEVVLEGKCPGLAGTEISFMQCRRVR